MIVPVRVSYCGFNSLTYAMLDTESQLTFCGAGLARKLQANGPRRFVSMYTLSAGQRAHVNDCMVIPRTVKGIEKEQSIDLYGVMTVPKIPLRATYIPSNEDLKHMKHLQGVKLFELKNKKVTLLIGLNASLVFRLLKSICGSISTSDAV